MKAEQLIKDRDGIAIIGMAGRFPGADNVEKFWQNLCDGVESITFFDENELDPSILENIFESPNYIKAKGVISNPDKFDAEFFGITASDAEMMDPQQRVFLETSWDALESAGYVSESYDGLIGVFAGNWRNTYYENLIKHHQDKIDFYGDYQAYLANGSDYLATRVSYKLNLRGPSITVQTGCSTSLVAVALAHDYLMSYQCDIALAGGIFVGCPINNGYTYQEGDMRSKDGHCRPFDKIASGTVFSDGVGIVVLKRLDEAVKDKDNIYAIITGVAVNNDGSEKVGFTAPSVKGQADVVEMAQANANVDPETINYVECHGSGTILGDPIEIEALSQSFRKKTNKKGFCAIGSVKGNIGHLDAAAGVAGLIKTALIVYNRKIPPSINFNEINPNIEIDNSPFYINTDLTTLDTKKLVKAGVTSLGVGGTNVHLILEEYKLQKTDQEKNKYDVLLVSAKSPNQTEVALKNLLDFLENNRNESIRNISYTLKAGRSRFQNQIMVSCSSIEDAIETIKKNDVKKIARTNINKNEREVIFMFSGQGSQYPGMCSDIYKNESKFREIIDYCSTILYKKINFDIRDFIIDCKPDDEQINKELEKTYLAQPALFIIEYALANLLMSWGVKPKAMIGHSIGEYVAACIAGVFDLESGIDIVSERGRLIYEQPKGSMAAIFANEAEIESFICKEQKVSIAAVNSPDTCVISGNPLAVEKIINILDEKGFKHRRLHTSHAFHSVMMEPVLEKFNKFIKSVKLNEPRIPFLSNVTGNWITKDEAKSPVYWTKHIRAPVKFSSSVEKLIKRPYRIYVEIGPGNSLSTLVSTQASEEKGHLVFNTIPHPIEKKSSISQLLIAIGKLWYAGIEIDWKGFYGNKLPFRIHLPTYPFNRKKYWIDINIEKNKIQRLRNFKTKKNGFFQNRKKKDYPKNLVDLNRNEKSAENLVLDVWKKFFGNKDITIDDNYFEIGGTSLMAVRIFAELEKIIGKRLPLATLHKAQTVRELAQQIEGDNSYISWDPPVKIKNGKNETKILFCIHAEGGNVLDYRHLANFLYDDITVYGLQAKGLDGKIDEVPTVKNMAKEYLKEIRKIQNKGPYYICGYCLGGYIAYEIAKELNSQKEEIKFLGFINAGTPNYLRNYAQNYSFLGKLLFRIYERIELELDNMSVLKNKERVSYIYERLWRLNNLIKIRTQNLISRFLRKIGINYVPNSHGYQLQMLTDLQNKAFRKYRPKKSNLELILFNVKNQPKGLKKDCTLGWSKYVKNEIEIFEFDGYHKNILKPPYVKNVSTKMQAFLNN